MKIILLVLATFFFQTAWSQEIKVIKYPDLAKIIEEDNNQVRVINFWATWCGPCVKELPQFEALRQKYQSQDVQVILVSFDFVEQLAKARQFAQKKNLQSTLYLLDETDYNSFIDKIDPQWSGAIPATLMLDNRTNKRAFYEKEFKEHELEKTFAQFIN